MRGVRGALAAALALTLMELVLSAESNSKSPTATLLNSAFQYPARWVKAFIDPTTPAIPQVVVDNPATIPTGGAVPSGLSGTGTPSGTGSTLVKV